MKKRKSTTKGKSLVWCVECGECFDVVYSRARHDFRECSCGKSFVDGGGEYFRYGGDNIKTSKMYVDASRAELYNDWNTSKDKYGLMKGGL